MPVWRKPEGIDNLLDRVLITHSKEGRLPHGHQHERKRKEESLRRNMI
jgi:hypothetical protein